MHTQAWNTLVLNPDELGPDPVAGMNLATSLGIGRLEIRTVDGVNAIQLGQQRLREVRAMADERGLTVTALASPLWKWCLPGATAGRVDSFGFPTQVDTSERTRWVARAIETAQLLGARIIRIFSHLRVEAGLTQTMIGDPLLPEALAAAAQAGLRVLLENEPVCTVAHLQPLLEVLNRYRAQGLGLWLDVANLHEVGQGTPEAIAALAPFVEYVHVKDYTLTDQGRTFCAAGTGIVPYRELLPVLQRVCPGLPYALETHVRDDPAQALGAGAQFLRTVVPGIRR